MQVLMGVGLLGFLFVLLLPVWLPWVLTPVLRSLGVGIGEYERLGYDRFVLRQVRFTRENVKFSAERVETLQPLFWLGRPLGLSGVAREGFGEELRDPMPVVVTDWHLEISPGGEGTEDSELDSTAQLLNRIREVMEWVATWRPGIDFRDGTVRYQGEAVEVRRVRGGVDRISMEIISERLAAPIEGAVGWASGSGRTRLYFQWSTDLYAQPLVSRTSLVQAQGETGWQIEGNGHWGENRWRYDGVFGEEAWWPDHLTFSAEDWEVSLSPWEIPGYRVVVGGLRLGWTEEELTFRLEAEGEPKPANGQQSIEEGTEMAWPGATLEVAGVASMTRVLLQEAVVRSPGVNVELDGPLEFEVATRRVARPGNIRLEVQLEALSWLEGMLTDLELALPGEDEAGPLQGRMEGQIAIEPSDADWPLVELALSGDGLGWSLFQAERLTVHAAVEWPILRWSEFHLELQDGSQLRSDGQADLLSKRIDRAALEVGLEPGLVEPFLPEGFAFEGVSLDLEVEGAITPGWDQLSSAGELTVSGLVVPGLRPLEPVRMVWEPVHGERAEPGAAVHRWRVEMRNGESRIEMAGALRHALEDGRIEVPLEQILWQPGVDEEGEARAIVGLEKPVTVTLSGLHGASAEVKSPLSVEVPGLVLRAESAAGLASPDAPSAAIKLAIEWPARGEIQLELMNWRASWLEDWLEISEEKAGPVIWEAGLDLLRIQAAWADGPLVYTVDAAVHAPHPVRLGSGWSDETVQVELRLAGDGEGARLESMRVEDRAGAWITGQGKVPMVLVPGAAQPLRVDSGDPFQIDWNVERRGSISLSLEQGQIVVDGIAARIRLGGSLSEPMGGVELRLERVQVLRVLEAEASGSTENNGLPEIHELKLDMVVNADNVELQRLELSVGGQQLAISASMPLARGFWAALPDSLSTLNLTETRGRVALGPVELEPFGWMLPAPLRAQGQLAIDLRWEQGLSIGGEVEFRELATQPIPPAGAVQELNGRVVMEGSMVRMEEIGAVLGGRRLKVSGWLDLRPTIGALVRRMPGTLEEALRLPLPLWDIGFTGDRLPVVRRPGMVIRTGLDVRTTHDGEAAPLIAGVITPRDSVFITDIRTMLPRGPTTPMPRPPFIRFEHPLVRDWRLELQVQGEEFLRVRSPVFRGVLSVGLRIGGRLGAPVLIGDVMIADGRLQFPFGNLEVTQGLVSLSEVDPTRLSLLVNASSRVYGYQVSLSISGTAESPELVFSSIPPLPSEEILLMLTAGQLPRDEMTFTSQQRATALASYLGKTLIDSWALEDPGEERLLIRSGESISVGGRVTYYIEYLLHGRWSLVAEYDEYDDVNAGVKYRLIYR